MLLSPPFLPDRGTLSEAAWLDAAMPPSPFLSEETLAPEGSFPLGLGLAWHNGLHLQAPRTAAGAFLPVRAVADGRVVCVHAPTPPHTDLDHPLNYNPFACGTPRPAWTSDGFIVLRHATEIGAHGSTPTRVVYFSVCMHLGRIAANPRRDAPWQVGDDVYRKEVLGDPGRIYGHDGQIHFEICCDEANLRQFMPRAPAWTHPLTPEVPTANGRTDSVFGSVYIYLPAGTPTRAEAPTAHLRAADPRTGSASAATGHFAPHTLPHALWVRITHDRGDALIDSHDALGARIGTTHREPGGEYDLYDTATRRHDSLEAASRARSSPSGWYELLRFGRNLGPDPLPEDAAHWREIPTATGTVWADLNAPGTRVFSDADFPAVMGWNCFGDDTRPDDQRCDSVNLKMLIRDPDPANAERMELSRLTRRLGRPEVRAALRRAVCRFPSEWEQETIAQRHGWLKQKNLYCKDDASASQRNWERFFRHAQALTFTQLPAEFLAAQWRFHPREFIGVMRKCLWLSAAEFSRIYPNTYTRFFKGKIESAPNALDISTRERYRQIINMVSRKYLVSENPERLAHFLGQGAEESRTLTLMNERRSETSCNQLYQGRMGNTVPGDGYLFRGRGMKQLTGKYNYSEYWIYRNWLDRKSFTPSWWSAGPRAINPIINDPNILLADHFSTIDVGGWYWAASPHKGAPHKQSSISRHIKPSAKPTTKDVETITSSINGGLTAVENRLFHTQNIYKIIGDEI